MIERDSVFHYTKKASDAKLMSELAQAKGDAEYPRQTKYKAEDYDQITVPLRSTECRRNKNPW